MVKSTIEGQVKGIISRVKRDGDKAVCAFTAKLDKIQIKPGDFLISQKEMLRSMKFVKPSVLEALKAAAGNIQDFYIKEKASLGKGWKFKRGGKTIAQRLVPIESVGVYVPGGRYSYPSSVLMGAIPARIAGVRRVVVATPPGKVTPEILTAAYLAGVDKIYRVGGPQAIAALAYGTRTIERTDKIVGPGNVYVTEAKKLVFGDAGIDMLAGPSEIVIIADKTAEISFIKNDLLAQLEHDSLARACLITWDAKLEKNIKKALPRKAVSRVRFIKTRNVKEAVIESDRIAPEHLEIVCKGARAAAGLIKNAGVIFVGNYSPVALGDYTAGSSHVLPTGCSARFSSGLSVADFMKRMNIIEYNRESCRKESLYAVSIASAEGMKSHGDSLKARLRK